MGGIYQPDLLQKYIGMGVKLILAGSDLSLLMSAGKARVADIRAAQ
jgi:2-keto-3-deoxy-L-rhamnonate aldolase RhmA